MKPSDLIALSRRHVWPPYTSSERHEGVDPLVIVGAEGIHLHDASGRQFVDANSSWWTCTLGHGHPRLRAALIAQAQQLMHVSAAGITHPSIALLSSELAKVAPAGLTRAHFSDDGSTAVEVAIKIAFQYWQQNGRPERRRFVSLSGAYHGDTLGATSVAGNEEFHRVFAPLLFEVIRPPAEERDWDRIVEYLQTELRSHGSEIAAVIVEPLLQGASGMRMHTPAVLRAIADATRQADTFLIADEVFTGYGRTGTMWACDQAGVSPDLLCTAKGFTAGVLPMAATLATERVYDGFRGGMDRALMHGHTFCGNPLGAAVAREVLAIYRDEDIVGQVQKKAAIVERGFARIASLPSVRRVRSLGLVGAADLGEHGYHGALGWRVFEQALARGVYLRPLGDTIYVAPPFVIGERELGDLLDVVYECAAAATG